MKVGVGVDHAGFPLKGTVVKLVEELGHTVEDFGTDGPEPVDYPDFARAVAEAVAAGRSDRGILICGSGVGTSIAANKVPRVRAGLCEDVFSARQGVEDDDMNVLCLGARVIGSGLAVELVRAFLAARFSNEERHARRLAKIKAIEDAACRGAFATPSSRP